MIFDLPMILPGVSGGDAIVFAEFAKIDGVPRLLAVATLGDLHKNSPFINTVFVHKDVRRKGIARGLLRRCIEEARKRNKPRVLIWVDEENPEARALYDSLGFIVSNETAGGSVPMVLPLPPQAVADDEKPADDLFDSSPKSALGTH